MSTNVEPTLQASIIIPTYNRCTILRKVITALASQTIDTNLYEVVVVDDASTDDTLAMLNELEVPFAMQVIPLDDQHGPAGARNAGLRLARSELIIFLDSDLVPSPQLVQAHINAHQGQEKRIGHGPVIHTTNLDNPSEAEMKLTDISRAFFATGNASIRRQHLFDAGLFDEDFREYGWEDLEFGRRLRKLGLEATPVPEAKGYHYKASLQLSQLPALLERERQRARTALIYYHKHPETSVRFSIMLSPIVFYLDRLLTFSGWSNKKRTITKLQRLEKAGHHMRLRFWVRLMTHHAYVEELRKNIPRHDAAHRWVR